MQVVQAPAPTTAAPLPPLAGLVLASLIALAAVISTPSMATARPPTLPPRTTAEPTPDWILVESAWLTVLWLEGEASSGSEQGREGAMSPLVLGEQLGPGHVIEAPPRARLVLLSGGETLVYLMGPGRWLLESDRITTLPLQADTRVMSPRARLERLDGYREGPLPMLQPMSSQPMLVDTFSPLTLMVLQPAAPVTRSVRPEIRWHWPYEGGRFDLLVELTDASGTEDAGVVERWRNLDGRAHLPWAELVPGATYRISISHASNSDKDRPRTGPADSPITDSRIVHVLAPSELAAVDGATASLEAIQGAGPRFRPEIDVLRARLLESHGLWDEAELVWTGLAILYPDRDDVLHHALRLHARSLDR